MTQITTEFLKQLTEYVKTLSAKHILDVETKDAGV